MMTRNPLGPVNAADSKLIAPRRPPPGLRALASVLVAAFVLLAGSPLVVAQLDPSALRAAQAATVQLAIRVATMTRGQLTEEMVPLGSGTIVSPRGVILTNAHVIDPAAIDAVAANRMATLVGEDPDASVEVDAGQIVVLVTEPGEPPIPRYTAEMVAVNRLHDLAVLQITGGSRGQPLADGATDLPYLRIGDSDGLALADPVFILGYPIVTGAVLTYTAGEVNTFQFEPGITGYAWIVSSAAASGGNSGGAALDRSGQLIGVPTESTQLDCRRADTNGDGVIGDEDTGCIPLGGSFVKLRPINLAKDLLASVDASILDAGSEPPSEPLGSNPPPAAESPTPTPSPTPPPLPTPTPSPTPPPAPTSTPPPVMPPISPPTTSPPPDAAVLLPSSIALPHGTCFTVRGGGALDFATLLNRFAAIPDAANQFSDWGWRSGAYRQFGCDFPPSGSVGYFDIGIHVLGDASSAKAAVPYFAETRVRVSDAVFAPAPAIGDTAVAITAPASNGWEYTLYASTGSVLVRVTGVAPSGDPAPDVVAETRDLLDRIGA